MARLFVITARDAPVAVIVRRGPSSWTHVMLWQMQSDTFTPGAWFRGRIYEEKCDLSPDGELFVYAVHQGRRLRTDYTDAWTAVSRPPWLHALALWPMGTTYGGGGRFVDRRRLVLRGVGAPHPEHLPTRLVVENGTPELQSSTNEVEGADWSGRDPNNALIFARDGRIYRRLGGIDRELVDLREAQPDPSPAPQWARRPVGR